MTNGIEGVEGPQNLHIRGPSALSENNNTQSAIIYTAFERQSMNLIRTNKKHFKVFPDT